MKKIIFGLTLVSLLSFSCLVNANAAVSGIEARMVLSKTSVSATIYESKMPPYSSKSLNGTYTIKDARGEKRKKGFSGSINQGQLYVTREADAHFISESAFYYYTINGIAQPEKIQRTY